MSPKVDSDILSRRTKGENTFEKSVKYKDDIINPNKVTMKIIEHQ